MNVLNPESYSSIIPHAIYSTHKNARRQVQSQRQQAQHTISFLERQAKKQAKQLVMKQKSLLNYYKLKQSRFYQSLQKQKLRKKREEELDRQRKTNTLLRQNSIIQKAMKQQRLLKQNHRSYSEMKRDISQSQRRVKQQKQLENQLLRKKNQNLTKAVVQATGHARVKSLFTKRHQSSQVKKDLIYVQQRIKNRQMQTIGHLNSRQKELLEIVSKNKRQKEHYDSALKQFQATPFDQLYPAIKQKAASQRSGSRRSSMRSQSLFI